MGNRIGKLSSSPSGEDVIIEWEIPAFTYLERDAYSSPNFSFGGENWFLEIFPNASSGRGSSRHVDLRLGKWPSNRFIKQSFSLSLKNVNGEKYIGQHCMKDFDDNVFFHEFNRFIPRSELMRRRSDLLPEGFLTIVCVMKNTTSVGSASSTACASAECCHCKGTFNVASLSSHQKKCMHRPVKCPDCLEVVELQMWLEEHECQQERTEAAKHLEQNSQNAYVGGTTQRVEASTQTVKEKSEACASGSSTNCQEKTVFQDFKDLFLKKEECDVTIRVKGSEFPAHRLILRARSPVLASTFRHDMKENVTGVLEIDDCDSSTFSDFLCFLYCGDDGIISAENVFGLFSAADKYQVLDLRAKCLEYMKMNITVDTFCETITLALRHSEAELIKLSTDYFKKNVPKIIVTVKWQTFLAENPTESNELLVKFFVPNSS